VSIDVQPVPPSLVVTGDAVAVTIVLDSSMLYATMQFVLTGTLRSPTTTTFSLDRRTVTFT
jgi:hypothetical protein